MSNDYLFGIKYFHDYLTNKKVLFFVDHPRLDHQFVWNFYYSIKNLDLLKINKENESFYFTNKL